MKIGSFFKHYFSSVLGLINIFLPILTVIAVIAAGFSWSIGVIAALADGFMMFIFAFISGRGAKAVVEEKDRRILLDYGQSLEKIRALSSRALAIRLADSGLGKIKDYAALKAGEYAVAAQRENTWDPKVLEGIENILGLIDVFQKGADQVATEARFGIESQLSAGDFTQRIADLMKQETLKITDALSSLDPGTVEDRLSVMEDLT